MPKETQLTRLHCAECGIGYPMWVMNETPCEGGEECHDWEGSLDDDEETPEGENVVIGGQVAYKVGGFITWD